VNEAPFPFGWLLAGMLAFPLPKVTAVSTVKPPSLPNSLTKALLDDSELELELEAELEELLLELDLDEEDDEPSYESVYSASSNPRLFG